MFWIVGLIAVILVMMGCVEVDLQFHFLVLGQCLFFLFIFLLRFLAMLEKLQSQTGMRINAYGLLDADSDFGAMKIDGLN
jgi:hypothetical protein